MKQKISKIKPYPLRLSDQVRATLESYAQENKRSLNDEITIRLNDSLGKNFNPYPAPFSLDELKIVIEEYSNNKEYKLCTLNYIETGQFHRINMWSI